MMRETPTKCMPSTTVEQLLHDAPTSAAAEVIRAAARTAPTGDALLADIVGRHDGRWLDELTLDEMRDAWRHYNALTTWPHLGTGTSNGTRPLLRFWRVLPVPAEASNPKYRSLSCCDCSRPVPAGRARCQPCFNEGRRTA